MGSGSRVTRAAGGQAGSFFSSATVDASSFSTKFSFRFTNPGGSTFDCNDTNGADGSIVIRTTAGTITLRGGTATTEDAVRGADGTSSSPARGHHDDPYDDDGHHGDHHEAHEPLALAVLERLCAAALDEFALEAVAVVHRLGLVEAGEASIAVAASAPHRREAFAAAERLMERIKAEVPIWKCEHRPGGGREWVHDAGRAGGRR